MNKMPQKLLASRRALATRLEELLGRRQADDGFTMIELIVAMLIIGIVMAAFSTFFITTVSATSRQSFSQAATQLGDDAIEQARAIKGSSLLTGRDKTSSDTEWTHPVTGVATYLSDMQEAYSTAATAGSGATAPLPTTYSTDTVDGTVYNQYWYVGTCWQPSSGGACVATDATGSGVAFYRVVIAVTWPDHRCSGSICSYVATTLISGVSSEPLFLANGTAQPPAVTNPGAQTSEVTVADTLQMAEVGGAPAIAWSASGLPTGMSISATTGLISGTPTTANTYSVTVNATDGFNLIGSTAFSWVVNAAPALSSPGAQTEMVGASDTINPVLTGGTPSYTWSATGLPNGVTADASSGVISGTPTASGTYTVTLKAIDSYGLSSSTTFTITVAPALTVTDPPDQTGVIGTALTALQMAATGGSGSYTWTATGLPAGASISTSGKVTGTPTTSGTTTATIKATDTAGNTASVTVNWTISVKLAATDPPDQTGDVGTALVALQMTATGGTGGYTWTATGLPAGVSISTSGNITGTPTGAGTTATITVKDSSGATSSVTVKWTIAAAPNITAPAGNRTNAHGTAVTVTATVTGGTGTYTWTATNLPPGLSINSSTGKISGTISSSNSAKGNYSTTVTATDSVGGSDTNAFTWTVS
jgi:prepilin-type N-terminal cleavage/methylation domain-containing protein